MKLLEDKGLGMSGKEDETSGNSVLNLAKVGVVGSNPIARSIFLLQTSIAAQYWTFRRSPAARDPCTPLLADVERVPLLQVEVQMGTVDVVGFWAKHRGEHLAGALMHAPEELGLRK